jgi:hypothetical protein
VTILALLQFAEEDDMITEDRLLMLSDGGTPLLPLPDSDN